MRRFKTARCVSLAASIAAIVMLVPAPAALASKKPPPTFTIFEGTTIAGCYTFESGCLYQSAAEEPFTLTANECTEDVDTNVTGTMVFTNATTHKKIGSGKLSPNPPQHGGGNCSETSVVDHEALRAGDYTIKASYKPNGSNPFPKSKGSMTAELLAP
jgi:hypothetical protein